MTPDEIMQMFVDLRELTYDAISEIEAQAKSAMDVLEGLIDRMPKAQS
jgi:hypothetical protein